MHTLLRSAIVLSLLVTGAAHAGTVTVTSVSNTAAPNTWYLNEFRGLSNGRTSDTFAGITASNPRNGNASVEMSSTDGSGKADYVYAWGYVSGRTLGNVDTIGLDWFRAPGTSAEHLAPAMRLIYDADGDEGTPDDRGYLIWEQYYSGGVPQNQWVSSDLRNQYFWQRQFAPGNTVTDYDISLAQWAAGAVADTTNSELKTFDLLSANTAILGIEFGIGSGWANTFTGYVDNVRIGFAGQGSTTFNFELAQAEVPEPASLALLGLGALGFAARRRKQK